MRRGFGRDKVGVTGCELFKCFEYDLPTTSEKIDCTGLGPLVGSVRLKLAKRCLRPGLE